MKKIFLTLFSLVFVITLHAQNEQLLGKWNVFEMTAEGKTFSLEQLKEFGKDKDYLEIRSESVFKMFDDGIVLNGSWKLNEENALVVVLQPSEQAKAQGQGEMTMNYVLVDVNDQYLSLKLGEMIYKYTRAVE